jgi:hypothetical protein
MEVRGIEPPSEHNIQRLKNSTNQAQGRGTYWETTRRWRFKSSHPDLF